MKRIPKFKAPELQMKISHYDAISLSEALELNQLDIGLFGKPLQAMYTLQAKYKHVGLCTIYTRESFELLMQSLKAYKQELLEYQIYYRKEINK